MTLLEKLQKRANLVVQARALVEAANKESRGLSQEENNQYDQLMDQVTRLGEEVKREQQLAAMETTLNDPLDQAQRSEPGGNGNQPAIEFRSRGMIATRDAPGSFTEPGWQRLMRYAQPAYRSAFNSWMRVMENTGTERRALQADIGESGGYLVAPLQMVDRMIQAMDNLLYMRQWATIFTVPDAETLGAPSLDADPADATWTSELAIGSEDSTMDFGRRELTPHPLAKYIKMSRKLLRKVPSVEDLVIQRLAYKHAVPQENAFLNGSGTGEPLGVFTASNNGIPTTYDVSTGNTATTIEFDGLIEAKYKLKQQYWARARWMFHADGAKQIAKLQDSDGQYIWRESVRVGEPDRLLGLPIFMSEYVPHTFTTGLYVGILGDFSYYWIADSMAMEMQRLVELYAATNQIALIGRLESDGMPVLGEAFRRVKLA